MTQISKGRKINN